MTGRRRIIAGLACILVPAPALLLAQPSHGLPRVGFVLSSAPLHTMTGDEPAETVMRGFVHGLRALGYTDGKNIQIERRSAEGKLDRQERLIRGLAEARVDVIVVTGNPMSLLAKKVTSSVPVVVAGMATPVESGIVRSLSRPEANITGLAVNFGPELGVKRLEQLRELVPDARRVAYLGIREEWDAPYNLATRAAAADMGIIFYFVDARLPRIQMAFEELERDRPGALYVAGAAPLFVHRAAIAQFAARIRVPDFHLYAQAVEAGAFASYGHDPYDIFRRAAGYVDRILKGAKPADLPVEQMERYSLVLNMKTAKILGITVPQSVLLRADRVIE